jgi:hypothetical protein
MMSDPFREREKGFEAKYQQDEALRFRILTRRNKLLGLWVAGEMGLDGTEAEAYARDLVEYDLVHGAPDGIYDKALSDLSAKGIEINRHRLELRAAKLLHEAESMIERELIGGAS